MRLLLIVGMFLLATTALAREVRDPNSPEFDPVARMKRFFPDWQPPEVSEEELARHPLGSEQRPVRTQGPRGQHEYLQRLLCKNGKTPKFQRMGSVIQPSPYGFPMDTYEVKCGAFSRTTIYMDLYHPRFVEKEPVPGFSIQD